MDVSFSAAPEGKAAAASTSAKRAVLVACALLGVSLYASQERRHAAAEARQSAAHLEMQRLVSRFAEATRAPGAGALADGELAAGAPAAGAPAVGAPTVGAPAAGTSVAGALAGTPTAGAQAAGTSAAHAPAVGIPAAGALSARVLAAGALPGANRPALTVRNLFYDKKDAVYCGEINGQTRHGTEPALKDGVRIFVCGTGLRD